MIIEALKQNQCILAWNGQVATANAPKAITPAGNVTQLLPFSGAGIGMFDGTGDYLTVTYNSDLDPGANDFYFECYVYFLSQAERFILVASTTSTLPFYISMYPSTYKLHFQFKNSSVTSYNAESASAITTGAWHHCVCQRTGNNIAVALDGVWGTSTDITGSALVAGTNWLIGEWYNATRYMYGNLSEFKYKIGSSPYTIGTNFTPQYRQLESDSNTKLLLHFNTTGTAFTDYSPSAHTITPAGNATQLCSPCGSGVAYFDGSGDYLSTPDSADFAFGTGNFTFECNFYRTSASFNNNYQLLMTHGNGDGGANVLRFGIGSANILYFDIVSADVYIAQLSYSITFALYTWYHVAAVRSGGNLYLFIDGTLVDSDTTSITYPNYTGAFIIGAFHSSGTTYNRNFPGYMTDVRVSNYARYTEAFVPSTIPFKPDPYTKLLLHMDGTGAAFYDSSDPPGDNGFPILPDGVTITPTGTFAVQKMKDGRNIWAFDGSTNYITISDHASWSMFLNDFTIAGWFKFDSIAANRLIIGQYVDANNQWYMVWTTSNVIQLYGIVSGTATFNYSCPLTAVANTWYHMVVERSGSSCIMYVNGVAQTVTATTAWTAVATNIASTLNIGGMNSVYMLGNIKDLQLLPGKALSLDQIGALYQETFIY